MIAGLNDKEREALLQMRRALPHCKTVLIGAAALGVHIPMTWRRTADLDLTVITDQGTLSVELKLLGFRSHPKLEHAWLTADGSVRLDVLPATEADLARGQVVFERSGNVMSLAGFDLALKHTVTLSLAPDSSIEIASLPALVLLKIASWMDRPSQRQRDLDDLGHVLSEYLAADDLRRWEDPRLGDTVDFDDQAALALGLDLDAVMRPSHRALVESFLRQMDHPDSTAFENLARASSRGADPVTALSSKLRALRIGLGPN